MPVRFKGSSEYKTHFQWHDSRKSASFCPSPEQSAKEAGLKSAELSFTSGCVREPPLQRKRYPINPSAKVTATTKMYTEDPSEESVDIVVPSKTYIKKKHPDSGDRSNSYKLSKHRPKTDDYYRHKDEHKIDAAKTYKLDPEAAKAKTYKTDPRVDKGKTFKLDLKKIAKEDSVKAAVVAGKPKVVDRREEKENIDVNQDVASEQSERGLKYRAGHRRKPPGPKRLSEYQRQFAWKTPAFKESPLIAAEQMIYNSNAIQTYMPKNVPSKSEYDAQFQAWNESRPSQVEMLKEHAKRDAELEVKQKKKSSKGKRRKSGSKKEVVTPDQMPAAGVPTFHLPEQLKNAQNPQKPFFPHAAIKKWKSEYRSNYHDPRVFSYMDGVWRGADPPHIEPRDESSKQEKIGVAPDWFGEVVELRKKAQEYQKRARGTHFSREHLAQLLAQQVKMWEMESVSSTSTLTPSERTVSTARPAAGKTYTKEVAAQQQAKLAREEERRKLTPSPSPSPHDSERTPQPASVKRKLAWPVDEKPRQEEVSSIGTIPTPESLQSSSRDTLTPNDDDEEGRIPTPRLTKKPDASKQRHHLARTTPAVGGALLSSPNIKRSSGVKKQSPSSKESGAKLQPASENGYRSDDEDSVPQLSRKMVQKSSPKHSRYQADKVPCSCGADVKSHTKLIKSPSAGVHTRDPDPIEENYPTSPFQRHSQNRFETGPVRLPEESSPPRPVDSRPLKTWAGHPVDQPRPKVTPKKDSRESDQPPSYLRKPAEAWSVPLEPSTRAAQYSRPDSGFITPPPRPEARLDLQDDEDRWSVKSTGTVSSSCSLASEVLERARRRRDEFWGKQPSVQTK